MHIKLVIENSLKTLPKNTNIAVALSTGVDSVVLANILSNNQAYLEENNINLYFLHFNHKLRKESDDEEKFVVENYKNSIIGVWENSKNTEEEARNARYEFFEKTMSDNNIDYLYVGQHADDLVERHFMKVLKGTSIKGLTSFSEVSTENLLKNRTILRPFLNNVTKEDIYLYAKENNLVWFEDKTNKGNDYLRTRMRNNYLPKFYKEDNNFGKHVVQLDKDLKDLQELLQEKVDNLIRNNYSKTVLDQPLLKQEAFGDNMLVNKELVKFLCNKVSCKLLSNERLEGFVNFIKNGELNTRTLVQEGVYLFVDKIGEEKVILLMLKEDFECTESKESDKELGIVRYKSKNEKVSGKKLGKLYNEQKTSYHLRYKNILICDNNFKTR